MLFLISHVVEPGNNKSANCENVQVRVVLHAYVDTIMI